jgi:hypothetical protein
MIRLAQEVQSMEVADRVERGELAYSASTSERVAREWLHGNMPDLAPSPPMVSSATVTMSA